MVRILAAATLPINPPNAGIVLTLPQIWAGLISKCRAPQDFVKAMESCAIVDESETGMRRVVTYKKGQHPRGRAGEEEDDVQEKIELQAPMMATFTTPSSTVTNLISTGFRMPVNFPALAGKPSATLPTSYQPAPLYMTFTYSFDHPEIESLHSEEAASKQSMYEKMGIDQVGHMIGVLRLWVAQGKL